MSRSRKGVPPSHESQALYRLSRFSRPYRSRLLSGLQDVQSYCQINTELPLKRLLRQPKLADRVLGQYVMDQHKQDSGAALSRVKHALLGCQHLIPQLRGKLCTAWENIRVWQEQRTSKLRPPMPVPVWVLMVGLARGRGIVADTQRDRNVWLIMAILLELGLLCMLRPGELMKLKHSDFALPGQFNLSNSMAAIQITAPKNRRQFGDHQFVSLKNPNTISWLECFVVEGSQDPFWPASRYVFVKMFKQLVQDLGVTSCQFTPASLRPGGATHYFNQGIGIASLRFLGRWTAERSLEHYIQHAMSTQILNRLPPAAISRLRTLGALCIEQVLHRSCQSLAPCFSTKGSRRGADLVSWCEEYASLDSRIWKEESTRRSIGRKVI